MTPKRLSAAAAIIVGVVLARGVATGQTESIGETLSPLDAAAVAHATRVAAAAIDRASASARTVSAFRCHPLLAPTWALSPDLGAAETKATDLLAASRAKLSAGRQQADLAQIQAAGDLASSAVQEFECVRRAAASRLSEIRAARAQRVGEAPRPKARGAARVVTPAAAARQHQSPLTIQGPEDRAPAGHTRQTARGAGRVVTPAAAARQRQSPLTIHGQENQAPAGPPRGQTARGAGRVVTPAASAGQPQFPLTIHGQENRAPTGPPQELVAAARFYFNAQYVEAAQGLAHIDGYAGTAALQAHLIRAASRYALYLVGGEREESLRRGALEDVQACRQINAAFKPDPAAFSPRFVEFFHGHS